MAHQFHSTSLREYDIRGILGKTLGAEDADAIGRGFGTLIRRAGGNCVAVGYDGRESSPMLEEALVKGLTATGCNVVSVGLGPTPMLYYAEASMDDVDGGIMITGSHNPPDYNGFKMVFQGGPFFGADIQKLGAMATAGDWDDKSDTGTSREQPMLDAYIDRITKGADQFAEFRVGWDAGNGAAGPALEQLITKLPGEHHCIYTKVDGTFPNHHPDPTDEKNLTDLKRLVAHLDTHVTQLARRLLLSLHARRRLLQDMPIALDRHAVEPGRRVQVGIRRVRLLAGLCLGQLRAGRWGGDVKPVWWRRGSLTLPGAAGRVAAARTPRRHTLHKDIQIDGVRDRPKLVAELDVERVVRSRDRAREGVPSHHALGSVRLGGRGDHLEGAAVQQPRARPHLQPILARGRRAPLAGVCAVPVVAQACVGLGDATNGDDEETLPPARRDALAALGVERLDGERRELSHRHLALDHHTVPKPGIVGDGSRSRVA